MTPDVSAELEATVQRVQELADQVAAKAMENGLSWLEGYEKVLKDLLDLEEEAAKKSGVDWATTLATAHANSSGRPPRFFTARSKQLKSCGLLVPAVRPGQRRGQKQTQEEDSHDQ